MSETIASLFKPEEDIVKTGYKIDIDYVPNGEEPINLNLSLVSLRIVNEYEINMLPIVTLSVAVADPMLATIRDSYHEARITIAITINPVDLDNRMFSSMGDQYLKTTSFKIMDLDLPMKDDEFNEKEDTNKESGSNYTETNMVEFDLFAVPHLEMTKKLINRSYKDSDLEQALGCIFTSNAKLPVIMAKPHNSKSYEGIIIPPLNLKNAVYHLQNTYGIYKNGIRFFFDLNNIYLLDRIKGIGKDIGKTYYKVLVEVYTKRTRDPNYDSGYNVNESGAHEIRTSGSTQTKENELTTRHILGDNLKLCSYDNDNKFNKRQMEYRGQIEDYSPKEKFLWNPSSNVFVEEEFLSKAKETGMILTQEFADVPVDRFTPDKDFYFKFRGEAKGKYENGKYRIIGCGFSFSKRGSGDQHCRVEGLCRFVKVTE